MLLLDAQFFGELVTVVDKEAHLAMSLLLLVVCTDPEDIEFQSHERCERLLPENALRLQVHLLDCLGRQSFRVPDLLPLADAIELQEHHQRLRLFLCPAGTQRIVPDTLGLTQIILVGLYHLL